MTVGSSSDWLAWAATAECWTARMISALSPSLTDHEPVAPGRVRPAIGTPARSAAAVAARATAPSPLSPASGAMTSSRSGSY
jgi:hypothetical protein